MATVSKKEIIQKMEELKDGERLSLRLSPTSILLTKRVDKRDI
jgi:hypothetical protein